MLNNLQQVEQHDYSQNIFVGKVVANDDPLRLRRVKVSIPNLFEETNPANLPWIAPMFFGPVANGGTAGSAHLLPAIGTELIVEFQMGSPLHGLYIASPIRPGNLPEELVDNDWEWTYGWRDPVGNIFLVNTVTGNNTIRLFHASGTEFKILDIGKITIHGVENLEVQIDGDTDITTNGNTNVLTKGDTVVTTNGNTTVNTLGNTEVNTTGNATVNTQGDLQVTTHGNETHTVDGDFKVNASRIYLNES